MTLSIRDPETDQLARELARRYGKPITEVVKTALQDLAAKPTPAELTKDERMKKVREILARIDAMPIVDGRSSKEIMDELYDENGLPA
jgi:antitoxin VapB